MNRKIRNPFDSSVNKCFGCGPENPIGLKLRFEETDTGITAIWNPSTEYEGYSDVLHGGIIATLLDEAAAWLVYIKLETAGVTSELSVKYMHPVHLSKGTIKATASLSERNDRTASIRCVLTDGDSKECAVAVAEFFIFPREVAERRFRYPGPEAFRQVQ